MSLEFVLKEVSRCSFCGFCEHVCPTLVRYTRHFGPRGRIQTILFALKNNLATEKSIEGLYTCLTCNACRIQCPGDIKIAEVVREFRNSLRRGEVDIDEKVLKEVR